MLVKIWNLPQIGVNIKNIWNHHLENNNFCWDFLRQPHTWCFWLAASSHPANNPNMRGIPESEKMHFRCSEYTGSRVSESEFSSKLEDLDTPKKLRSTCPQDYTPGINDTSSEINLSHQSLSKGNFILPPYISVVKEKKDSLTCPLASLTFPLRLGLGKGQPRDTHTNQPRSTEKVPPGTSRWNACTNLCRALLKS